MAGSGYTLVLGVVAIIVVIIFGLAFNAYMPTIASAFTGFMTDPVAIQNTNTAVAAFGYVLFIIILFICIEIVRDAMKHPGDPYVQ